MISTRWFQGKNNIKEALEIRNKVFIEEMNLRESISDIFDDFAFNALVYEDDEAVGTGRLLFKEGKYYIDNVCVLKEYRGKHYGDLVIRMLVRKAVNMGAENTYAVVYNKNEHLFKNIGFEKVEEYGNNKSLMMKTGDVGGHCSGGCS